MEYLEEERRKKDLAILRALYFGNHLSDAEMERAAKLLYLLNQELKSRTK